MANLKKPRERVAENKEKNSVDTTEVEKAEVRILSSEVSASGYTLQSYNSFVSSADVYLQVIKYSTYFDEIFDVVNANKSEKLSKTENIDGGTF